MSVVLGIATCDDGESKSHRPWVDATGTPTPSVTDSTEPEPIVEEPTEVTAPTTEPTAEPEPIATPKAPAPTTSAAPARTGIHRLLAELRVTQRPRPGGDYRREAFGSSWVDIDGNGCNQRDDVLRRDAVKGTLRTGQQGSCGHDVLAGVWVDPYTGRRIALTDAKSPSQAQAIQIDHVVPLAEAWLSGAHSWTSAKRVSFANDLRNLLAVDGPTNASKGADDPAAWKPRKAYQCPYAKRWITTKHRWELTVDMSEVRALQEMLDYC